MSAFVAEMMKDGMKQKFRQETVTMAQHKTICDIF